jgi:hypothetical protein
LKFNPASKPWYPDAAATADGQVQQENTANTNAANATSRPRKPKYQGKKNNTTETSSVDGGVEIPREDGNQSGLAPKGKDHQKGRSKSGTRRKRDKKKATPTVTTEKEEDDGWGWAMKDFPDFREEHSPSYYEPDTRTEEEKHKWGHWTDCYDDSCMIHWGAKNASGKWPQRRWSDLKRGPEGY